MRVIKKYSNRRLYDTDDSHYITLDELAELIRKGSSVKVVDAKTSEDLTQGTLAQIVVESRGAAKLLPVQLLEQMIRMEDDALAEFMTNYMTLAFDMYDSTKRGVQGLTGMNPFGILPADMMSQWLTAMGRNPWERLRGRERRDKTDEDVDSLRREIADLKDLVKGMANKGEDENE